MQFAQRIGIEQRDFGRERTRTHPAPLLKFQQVATISENRSLFQTLQNSFFLHHWFSLVILIFVLRLDWLAFRESTRLEGADVDCLSLAVQQQFRHNQADRR